MPVVRGAPGAAAPDRYPFRGRSDSLEVVREGLALSQSGGGCVLVVTGQPGIGKSRFLRESILVATEVGFRTGNGVGRRGDEFVDLAPLMMAVCEGSQPLLDKRRIAKASETTPEHRYWVLNDLQGLLEEASENAPLMVCLDDMQWADSGTAAALRSLPQRLAAFPIFWIVASRPNEVSSPVADAMSELLDGGALSIHLGPIDESGVADIAGDVLGGMPDEAVMKATRRAAGNPFLLMELLLGLREEELLTIAAGNATLREERLPERIVNSMSQRMSRLSPRAQAILLAAASLGQQFSLAQVSALTDLSVGELLEPIQELIRSDLIGEQADRLNFQHDIIRDGVRVSCSASIRRALDRRAADVLLERGAYPVEVAFQLANSAEPGDDKAVSILLAAADSLALSDPAGSAELATRALALASPNHPARGELVSRAAVSLFAAGRTQEAVAFADVALRVTLPPEDEAQVRIGICRMFFVSPDVRTHNARKALALPGISTDTRALLWSYLFHNLVDAGRTQEALEMEPEVAKAVAQSATSSGVFAYEFAKSGWEYQQSNFDAALAYLNQADMHRVEGVDEPRERLASAFRCWLMATLDKPQEALAIADEGIAAGKRDRQLWAINLFETCKARQLFQMGRLAEASTLLQGRYGYDEAHLIASAPEASSLVIQARVRRQMGDASSAAIAAGIAKSLIGHSALIVQRHAAWLLALYSGSNDRVEEAYHWVCYFGEDEALQLVTLFPFEPTDNMELVRIAKVSGHTRLAHNAAERAESRWRKNPDVRSLRAVACHSMGLVENSVELLSEGASLYEETSRPLFQSMALEDLGRTLSKYGSKSDAIDAYDRALRLYTEYGAIWDAARVRQKLAKLGVRRRMAQARRPLFGWDSLTESESKVAELVTQGLSNRAIGEQLFISPFTVGTHLRHVFEKLGINSRVSLTNLKREMETNAG